MSNRNCRSSTCKILVDLSGETLFRSLIAIAYAAKKKLLWTLAILLAFITFSPTSAQVLPDSGVVDLATLDGSNGFTLIDLEDGSWAGDAVSGAGDLNGDGYDDLVIGAHRAAGQLGKAYIVFGSPNLRSEANIDLTSIVENFDPNVDNWFTFYGLSSLAEQVGWDVSEGGDINNDGFADLLVSAKKTSKAYVLLGSPSIGVSGFLSPGQIGASTGIEISGLARGRLLGYSVSSAGDVNGDGFGDIFVGAPGARDLGNQLAYEGSVYVIFGSEHITGPIDVSALDGTDGFRIDGEYIGGNFGQVVSRAGDLNGDGIDDIVVGYPDYGDFGGNDRGGEKRGRAFVIFGSSEIGQAGELPSLGLGEGFTVTGEYPGDALGQSFGVSDINNDGYDDLAIGIPGRDGANQPNVGGAVVIFGNEEVGSSGILSPSDFSNGAEGFFIRGSDTGGAAGWALDGIEDTNGDGVNDLIVSTRDANEAYVLYGRSDIGASGLFQVIALNPEFENQDYGYVVRTSAATPGGNYVTGSVSNAGDLDGDGLSDIILGSKWQDTAYVLFGRLLDDDYEDDDTFETASRISNHSGGIQAGRNINDSGKDIDYVSFRAACESENVRVEIETSGNGGDTLIHLYDIDQTLIASDDNSGVGNFSKITTTIPRGDPYYVSIEEKDNDSIIVEYQFAYTKTCLTPSDVFEPNDSFETAGTIDAGETQFGHTIDSLGADKDYTQFTLSCTADVVVSITGTLTSDFTWLRMYDSNQSHIGSDFGSGNSPSKIQQRLIPGTYYISMEETLNDDEIASYNLSLDALCADDAYEPDNTLENATTLVSGVPQTDHSINGNGGDIDIATFELECDANVVIETSGNTGDTILSLRNSDGTGIAGDNNSGTNLFSRIEAVLPPGSYSVQVNEFGFNDYIANYTLAYDRTCIDILTDDSYEPDNTSAQPSALVSGQPQTGHNLNEFGADVDWTAFTLECDADVVVQTSGASGDTVMILYRVTPFGSITSDNDSGVGRFSKIEMRLDAGNYLLRISEDGLNDEILDYEVSYNRSCISGTADDAFEPDDDAVTATVLLNGVPQTAHNINQSGADVDFSGVTLDCDADVIIETSGSVGDTELTLFDDVGSVIETDNDDGEGRFSRIERSLVAGDYRVRVNEFGMDAEIANYTLSYGRMCSVAPVDSVVSVSPLSASLSAPVRSNVTAQISGSIQSSLTDSVVALHRTAASGSFSASTSGGTTVVLDPDADFFPGEEVSVTISAGVETAFGPITPRVWSFRAGVPSGTGIFQPSEAETWNYAANSDLSAHLDESAELADLNGDGYLDILIDSTRNKRVWLGDGGGAFVLASTFDLAEPSERSAGIDFALGDIDGDGDLDVITATIGNGNKTWLNNGNGEFTAHGQSGSDNSHSVVLADIDADRDLDAIFANTGQPNTVWLNNGSGGFNDSLQQLGLGTIDSRAVDAGDIDNDGDIDVIFANQGHTDQVYLNDGAGTFIKAVTSGIGSVSSWDVSLGDLDGDGLADAVVANGGGFDHYRNDNGIFTDAGGYGERLAKGKVVLGDIDADGDLDVVVGSFRESLNAIWLNDGAGGFSLSPIHAGTSASIDHALGDVDNDGDLDLLHVHYDSTPSQLWINDGTMKLKQFEWYVFSLPTVVANNTVEDILADDLGQNIGPGVGSDWVVWKYDIQQDSPRYIPLSLQSVMEPNTGYWIRQDKVEVATVDIALSTLTPGIQKRRVCASEEGCLEHVLEKVTNGDVTGWQLFGSPYFNGPNMQDVRVRAYSGACADSDGCTIAEAKAAEVLDDKYWWYEGDTYKTTSLDKSFSPWRGYWVRSMAGSGAASPRIVIPQYVPSTADTDGDGDLDGVDSDDDNDGVLDADEATRGTDALLADTDGDGKSDGEEGTIDSDGDGIINALESSDDDADNDGVVDELDFNNTDPN